VITKTKPRAHRGSAFVELIVVVGIITLLIAILIPMFMHARQRSTNHYCTDNLRQLGQAMRAYAADYRGRLPCSLRSASTDPLPDRVSAAMFLLLKTQQLSPSLFVCPATEAIPDDFAGASPRTRSNFTDLRTNLSYSMQNPYATEAAEALGFTWTLDLPASFAIIADRNPAIPSLAEQIPGLDAILPSLKQVYVGNSTNHEGSGQNVLYADGRVEFQSTPFAGAAGDHIYLSRNNRVLDSPQDGADSILLPAQN
jgi:type II secretory pathway pseudopilin PulG